MGGSCGMNGTLKTDNVINCPEGGGTKEPKVIEYAMGGPR